MEEIKYKFNERTGDIMKQIYINDKIKSVINISAIYKIFLKNMKKRINILEEENKDLKERLFNLEEFINKFKEISI